MDKPPGFHPALFTSFFFFPATFAEPVNYVYTDTQMAIVSPDILKKQGKILIKNISVGKRVHLKDDGVSTLPQLVTKFHNL